MKEADALCTRIGILQRGLLTCVGSTRRLKSQLVRPYFLKIQLPKMPPRKLENIIRFVVDRFEWCDLVGADETHVSFEMIIHAANWASVFRGIKELNSLYSINGFSLGVATLEQVFSHAVGMSGNNPGSVSSASGMDDISVANLELELAKSEYIRTT